MAKETGTSINIKKNINDYMEFISFSRFYPDMFLDLIKPKVGGLELTIDQRVLMRSIVRFNSTYGVFSRGYGKCVKSDTMLFTTEGMKEIHSFFNVPKTNVESAQPTNISMVNKDGNIETSLIGIYDGYKPTKKITTREAYEIECTYDHPLLIMNSVGELEWKKSTDIKIGDFLCINRNNDIWGNRTQLDFDMSKFTIEHPRSDPVYLPNYMTGEFAYYLGLIIGDGCLTRNNTVGFTTVDDELSTFIESFYRNVLGKKKGSYHRNGTIDYSFQSMYFREYLKQIGFCSMDSHTKIIPPCILNSTKENVREFVSGMFDTDGTLDERCVSYTSASKKLITQLQIVLLNFGIISKTVYRTHGKFHNYTLYITGENIDLFNQNIGFKLTRKQRKLESYLGKKRNTNVDIIPHQTNKINTFFNKAKELNIINKKSFGSTWNVRAGENELSYSRLSCILNDNLAMKNTEEYIALDALRELNYFYSPVVSIDDSASFVYDVHMPETHSFISNG